MQRRCVRYVPLVRIFPVGIPNIVIGEITLMRKCSYYAKLNSPKTSSSMKQNIERDLSIREKNAQTGGL